MYDEIFDFDMDVEIFEKKTQKENGILLIGAIVVLLMFKVLGVELPAEYTLALFGITVFTPLVEAVISLYSLIKSKGEYVYEIEIETNNFGVELLIGLFAYLMTQLTKYLLYTGKELFTLQSVIMFLVAYFGVSIARHIDRRLIRISGLDIIVFSILFTIAFLFFYTIFFIQLMGLY